jgi:hypothetical protein
VLLRLDAQHGNCAPPASSHLMPYLPPVGLALGAHLRIENPHSVFKLLLDVVGHGQVRVS